MIDSHTNAVDSEEEEAASRQLQTIEDCTRVKMLLLRILRSPEIGIPNKADRRLKQLLEHDPSVVYASNPEFWAKHAPAHLYMDARQRRAFIKRHEINS